jgi:hypothetical protein
MFTVCHAILEHVKSRSSRSLDVSFHASFHVSFPVVGRSHVRALELRVATTLRGDYGDMTTGRFSSATIEYERCR